MATRATRYRTKNYERSGHHEARKEPVINRRLFLIALVALTFLLCMKVIVSGLYLRLDPMIFSASNIAIAEEDNTNTDLTIEEKERMLRKKEQELKEKEDRLSKMEKNLIPLQKEIDAKFEELNELQTRLTAFAKQLAERETALNDAKISHLVALYTAMEPDRAAVIMEKLNTNTIVRILGNMKGKSAGKILAMMEPRKGAMISERLSRMDPFD